MDLVSRPAYKGYKAFQFLEEGKDYPFHEWTTWDWAGRHVLECTPEEEARVAELLEKNIYISLHEHPMLYPADVRTVDRIYAGMRIGREMTAYEALSYSNLDVIFDNQYDGMNIISSPHGWRWIDIIHDLGMKLCDMAHQDFLVHVRHVDDIYRAKEEGKLGVVFVVEGAGCIENEVDRIDILYGLGVRQLGVTYSESNALGNGLKEDRDGGLTKFGRECVERMNKVGMLIDVSHCGPQTAYDAVKASSKPIIMSHCGAKALWGTKRLATDELLGAVAEGGGIIGIEAAPHTTLTYNDTTHSIEPFMEHFEYCVDKFGIDHVSFGVDSLYGDHVGVHHAFDAAMSVSEVSKKGVPPFEEVPFVGYLENPTEASWNIPRWLVKHGYSDEDIAKVLGKNTLRVLQEVWS